MEHQTTLLSAEHPARQSDVSAGSILFGLCTGQRLGDIATLRWNDLDLARGELRLSTRKTGKAIVQ
jgi:integrase